MLGWVAEEVAAEGAVAERGDEARLGHRVVGGEQRLGHAGGDGSGDEQDVGVPRRGDDAEAVALEVVKGVCDGAELVLAAVAGAGVDVADAPATAVRPRVRRALAADRRELSQQDEHQRSAQA